MAKEIRFISEEHRKGIYNIREKLSILVADMRDHQTQLDKYWQMFYSYYPSGNHSSGRSGLPNNNEELIKLYKMIVKIIDDMEHGRPLRIDEHIFGVTLYDIFKKVKSMRTVEELYKQNLVEIKDLAEIEDSQGGVIGKSIDFISNHLLSKSYKKFEERGSDERNIRLKTTRFKRKLMDKFPERECVSYIQDYSFPYGEKLIRAECKGDGLDFDIIQKHLALRREVLDYIIDVLEELSEKYKF